ncbi:MAG TPA: selenocysteine-specific translation elongation factor [Thermoanaerobaculia bacterium]|nr:selenocysteine-specific translation elongation factor [Thermoanaerobaculia bacterium]
MAGSPAPAGGRVRRVVVGTAGHVDHGKTRLVEALTGIDCDRWAEEKARGITIDLGFAHLERETPAGEPLEIGFVDVPGHERFLHNALAGLGGVRVMLLVVAADEGVKPQTREHLAICSLLGIPAGLVALTKSDLVEPDLLELARLEVEELLEGTPFAGAAVVAVSSSTGDGVPELEARLVALAAEHALGDSPEASALPARLPIDRAFHLKGLGVVVTGTLAAGRIALGDALEVLPAAGRAAPAQVRVRSIQVHGRSRGEALAGERSALQLAGAELPGLARGQQAAAPGRYQPTRRLLAEIRLLPEAPAALRGPTPVRVHLLSSEVLGTLRPLPAAGGGGAALEPGAAGPVEIRLRSPVVAIRGDRVIVRRPSPETTLGGGVVLDPAPRSGRLRGLTDSAHALAFAAVGMADPMITSWTAAPRATPKAGEPREPDPALLHWTRQAGPAGLDADSAARRLGLPPAEVAARLAALAGQGELLSAEEGGAGHARRWIAPAAYRAVAERARRVLAEYFERDRLARGIPKAEAIERILPGAAAGLAGVYLEWLAAQGVLALEGDLVNLPGRSAELTGEESALSKAVLAGFAAAGLTPASPAEIGRDLSAKPQILEGVVRYLVERGQLVRLPGGLILAASAIEELRRRLQATGWERFTVPEFKERFGLTRKWAIPILEHLDSIGATRRLGDQRLVVRPR